MKRLFVIFLLLFLPVVAVAEEETNSFPVYFDEMDELLDGCVENGKYKSEYTIDRRCYVTDEQKQQSPYNAVVGVSSITNPTGVLCTGTIVKRDDGYFLYTAKHCTDTNYDNRSDKVLVIQLQDGRMFDTSLVSQGNLETNVFGDWAHYKMPVDKDDASIPYAKTDSFKDGKVKIVGYGSLGILSDEQIKQIKDAYIKYLIEHEGIGEESLKRILTEDGGIEVNIFFRYFIRSTHEKSLKVSDCDLSNGMLKGCQLWFGNSGGPLFNDQGGIMGIVSTGASQFGGTEHATAGLIVGVYSDNKTNGRYNNWVASAGETQTYYTNQKQYYERQEREVIAKIEQQTKTDMQDNIRQNRQNKMQMQDTIRQNKQMMMNMARQYQ